jgi:hypothetical protein
VPPTSDPSPFQHAGRPDGLVVAQNTEDVNSVRLAGVVVGPEDAEIVATEGLAAGDPIVAGADEIEDPVGVVAAAAEPGDMTGGPEGVDPTRVVAGVVPGVGGTSPAVGLPLPNGSVKSGAGSVLVPAPPRYTDPDPAPSAIAATKLATVSDGLARLPIRFWI